MTLGSSHNVYENTGYNAWQIGHAHQMLVFSACLSLSFLTVMNIWFFSTWCIEHASRMLCIPSQLAGPWCHPHYLAPLVLDLPGVMCSIGWFPFDPHWNGLKSWSVSQADFLPTSAIVFAQPWAPLHPWFTPGPVSRFRTCLSQVSNLSHLPQLSDLETNIRTSRLYSWGTFFSKLQYFGHSWSKYFYK